MPKHQSLDHLRLEAQRTAAEQHQKDLGYFLARKPLDVIERAKIHS
jgi:hypothetical protein